MRPAVAIIWWIESDWSSWDVPVMRRRIEAGPPRVEMAAADPQRAAVRE
jgi:hypothetical protein